VTGAPDVAIAGGAGGGLLILLLILGIRQGKNSSGLDYQTNTPISASIEEFGPCPQEFISKIFSETDRTFISKTGSPGLKRLLMSERKQVALAWVRQTSAFIGMVMREHVASVRSSQDLQVATEASIVARYAQLMLTCGLLTIVIRVAGPFWLGGLALYAQKLSQRTAEVVLLLKPGVASGMPVTR
jgi:hypothetical protein